MESILTSGINPLTIVIGLMFLWSEIKQFRSKGKVDDEKILALERKIDHIELSSETMKTKMNLVESDFNTFKRDFSEVKITLQNLSTETRLEAKQQNKKMQLIFVGLQLICKEKGIDLKSFDLDQD